MRCCCGVQVRGEGGGEIDDCMVSVQQIRDGMALRMCNDISPCFFEVEYGRPSQKFLIFGENLFLFPINHCTCGVLCPINLCIAFEHEFYIYNN